VDFAREVEGWRMRLMAFERCTTPGIVQRRAVAQDRSGVPARAAPTDQPSAFAKFWSSLACCARLRSVASFAALVLAVGLGFAIRLHASSRRWSPCCSTATRAGAVIHAFADGRVVLVPLTSINVPEGRALESGRCRAASAARVGRP